ncbi:glutathione S-transferase T3-like isoform X1 [Carya illinoinensis]|uniref:No apical meristem-associated C-terminal domain-containing protein n=1 Tax=Carya illinoinensis TaxID=32201 RepID=A0A8T1PZW9_CARIL|nr:glutathione S-transferase T3-like isoform X1 [Carya illinoinensis]KAG6647748.1 hypothetical protein CIPAW_07G099700 [Carya illinoinensis]
MNCLIDDDPFFTTLLESDEIDINNPPMGSASVDVQATQPQREKRKQKSQRGVSFTAEEDTILVSAWLNISMDPIRGTDQSSTQMWSRIYEYYSTYKKPNCQERSIASLNNRWSIIQKCVNKFCGSLAQVEGMHPSDATEQDKIDKAKILYRENLKHNFTMDHCWNLLRHQSKWQAHMDLIKKKNGSSSGITLNSIPLGEDMENVPVDCERPPGKKAEKVREKERKCNERQNLVIKEALSQMTEDRRTCMMERRESQLKYENERSELLLLKKRKLDLEIKAEEDRSNLVTLKKRKVDIEIMSKDIDTLNGVQQEYFHNLQMEIIEEQRNRAISRT